MSITFEDIKKANELISTVNIKGKEYAEVNQRIKAFRSVFPTGFIVTEMLSNENGICVFKAEIGYYAYAVEHDVRVLLGTGTAYEKESSSFINKTSYIENCETSAVGRALGMAGFGIDTSIASAEELANAILNQNKKGKRLKSYMDDEKLKELVELAEGFGWTEEKLLENIQKRYKKSIMDLDVDEYTQIVNGLTGAIADGKSAE